MFKTRPNEPQYAKLWDKETKTTNVYGDSIETVTKDDIRREVSLHINEDGEIGDNPNRYKQHGFYFNADNCIGCHACESACSEKNDVPSHLAFRSVGFVEGGSFPDYQRLNISMACNHCDDPVCLKGCPTRAYTKFAEYGAVLQDPDICFGCGYCTWVCPYNAPQLDPVEGTVSKCNMCVDRLEVGLKPACVSACLGNALDFGVVENVPENREQAKTSIPGFPTTDITHPNIRFQQTKNTQRDMVRVDGMPIKYHKQEDGNFTSSLDESKVEQQKSWGIKKLLASHENAHAIFTLLSQMVMGASLLFILASFTGVLSVPTQSIIALIVLLFVLGFGLFKLNMHLGKPQFFYRGFYNLRLSPVSREIAGVSLFFSGLGLLLLAQFVPLSISPILMIIAGVVTVFGALLGSYYMMKLYLIPARPYWNHWHTGASFYGTILTLGAGLFAVLFGLSSLNLIAGVAISGLVLEGFGLLAHKKHNAKTGEASASAMLQNTEFGKTFALKNTLIISSIILLSVAIATQQTSLFYLALLPIIVASYLGRIIFYAVVVPTTMPGAFFWKNDQFKEHAIESGLSDMPQMGVMAQRHHKFDIGALIEVIKNTSIKKVFLQLKAIITG